VSTAYKDDEGASVRGEGEMRIIVFALFLIVLSGCATKKVLMRNCAWVDGVVFECESIK
jgi:hypothetical protein